MTARETDPLDPKGLIREAYQIDGITAAQCRSIFLDWALSLPKDAETAPLITALLQRHDSGEGHPMSQVLKDGLAAAPVARRRGGRAGRMPE